MTLPDLAALAARANDAHRDVDRLSTKAVEHAIAAGTALVEAKAQLKYGAWLPWLEANVKFSARTAQLYMRLARRTEDAQRVAHLGVYGADMALRGVDLGELEDDATEADLRRAVRRADRDHFDRDLDRAARGDADVQALRAAVGATERLAARVGSLSPNKVAAIATLAMNLRANADALIEKSNESSAATFMPLRPVEPGNVLAEAA
jgi:hypothetical protein